jgi:TDG/mug DNA glycosylase family protein
MTSSLQSQIPNNRYNSGRGDTIITGDRTVLRNNTQCLPDHIQSGVQILFVGINPGLRSAEVSHHYAGYSNRFWKLLYESNCVPVPLTYHNDWRLPEWGYGLTNIVERPTTGIHELTTDDYTKGRKILLTKIRRYQPKILAVLGITVRKALFPETTHTTAGKKTITDQSRVGLQDEIFGGAAVFVLPNPSGRNAHYSFEQMLDLFRQLRNLSKTSDL